VYPDFKELLSALNAHQVKYLVVGGYAVSFHAAPRATRDLDILIKADPDNGRAAFAALVQFGTPLEGLSSQDLVPHLRAISPRTRIAAVTQGSTTILTRDNQRR